MQIWGSIAAGLRTLLRRERSDRELEDEVRSFLAEAEADLVSRGATPEDARRRVRLDYGDPLAAREDVRGYGWEAVVDTTLNDVRLAFRSLRRSPGFTVVVVVTLGLGVGAATAILSAVRPVLFDPLPYPDADRLVSVADRAEDGVVTPTTFGTYREVLERSRSFTALSVYRPWQPTLTGGDEPVRLEGQAVTASYFDVLGIRPSLGPGFDAAEDRPGGARLVVISDGLWRERFGAAPDLVGATLRLDGEAATVVGVMPPRFENVVAPEARIWTLLQYDPALPGLDTREWGRHLEMLGRLTPGLPHEAAAGDLEAIARQPVELWARPAWASMERGFLLRPLGASVIADVKPALMVLVGAVALLITVTCANLTILLLARGSRRRGEFAMRQALGSPQSRLARYLVTEGLLLAAMGGVLGVVVAQVGLSALISVAPPSLPRVATVGVDGPALLWALGGSTLVGVLLGLAPGLHRTGASLPGLPELGRGTTRRSRKVRRVLVVGEVALATVLLVGAGLVLRSADRLLSQPLGLNPDALVVMQVYGTGLERGDAVTHRFFDEALAAVRSVPGVSAATMTSQLPLSGGSDRYGAVPDDPEAEARSLGSAERYAVTPGFFATMGMSVLQGRAFESTDVAGSPRVAVVSRSLARRLFPDGGVLGRRVRVGEPRLDPFTVVGVVNDAPHASLADELAEIVYVTSHQWHWADRVRWMVARTETEPDALLAEMRRAVWSVDADQPIVRAGTMQALVTRSEARRHFVMILLTAFAVTALLVSGVGLFGVLSEYVSEHTREMGVRAALGASTGRNVSTVVAQGLWMAAWGGALGVAGAVAMSGVLTTMLFEVSRLDPLTYGAVVALLGAGALTASVLPAVRAGQADPVEALRSE